MEITYLSGDAPSASYIDHGAFRLLPYADTFPYMVAVLQKRARTAPCI